MALLRDDKNDKQIEALYRKEEEDLVKVLSKKYGIPYADLSTVSIEADALKIIPEAEARTLGMAAFKITGHNLYIAILAPNRDGIAGKIEELKSKRFVPFLYMVSNGSLGRAWSRYREVSFATETKSVILDISQ